MEIKISRSAHACSSSGRAFVHEEPVVSVLRRAEGALVREDFAREAFGDPQSEGAFSVWTTKYVDPKAADAQPPEAFSPLRQAFYESVDAEDRVGRAKAFLAAQLLRRQKAFRFVRESEDPETGGSIHQFTDRIASRLVEVRDPGFTFHELNDARNALVLRLEELERAEAAGENSSEALAEADAPDAPHLDSSDRTGDA